MSHHDVVVVGIGLAGLTAATRLAESGARVLVLAKGVGATHLSPGTIDVLGYDSERVVSPREALGRLGEEHPYARVGADGVADAVEWFTGRFGRGPLAPYGYVGSIEENLLLPTAVGALKPTAVVPETMAAGDLRGAGGEILVVGLRALKDFHAALCADNLRRAGIPARAIELDLVPEGRVDVNSLGWARALDDAGFRASVAARVAPTLQGALRVAFPAVLGIADPHSAWSDLQARLGRPVFEIPTLPPSVPGMRVFATLREALRRAGGKVVLNAVVVGAERDGPRVRALRARTGLREQAYGADHVVLATGGFATGGIELDSRWHARETALGLEVAGVGETRFVARYFEEQPIARAGVAVDGALRPAGLENVVVAGATLAGAAPWREKSGDGISLATGYRAAELIGAAAPAMTAEAAR